MKRVFPEPLKAGDEVRMVAPSTSFRIIDPACREVANRRLESDLGFKLSFGRHVEETDAFGSSSVASRLEDLHEAFRDPAVKGILTVIGGYSCNQLLGGMDWDLIARNPKVFCGFSDITALSHAILARTGLVTFSGPHFSTFGQLRHFEYTMESFKACVLSRAPYRILPSPQWSDDRWFLDQEKRTLEENPGWTVFSEGEAEGTLLGANLCTLNLLQGTEYMPDLDGSVLFVEDDCESQPHTFDRDLQSLIQQPGFSKVRGMVIGRFQRASRMAPELLAAIVKSKPELSRIPVLAGADFGHTDPKFTFPIGGTVRMKASRSGSSLEILARER